MSAVTLTNEIRVTYPRILASPVYALKRRIRDPDPSQLNIL